MHFGYLFSFKYFRFLENMHFSLAESLSLRLSLKTCFYKFRTFSCKKSSKNPSKIKPGRLKKRCQKHVIFGHRLFRVLASILESLGPPSWRQNGRLGLPVRSQKSPKSNFLGACVQDACKEAPKMSPRSPRRRILDDFRRIWERFCIIFGYKNQFS